jgi:hypothetical protein
MSFYMIYFTYQNKISRLTATLWQWTAFAEQYLKKQKIAMNTAALILYIQLFHFLYRMVNCAGC